MEELLRIGRLAEITNTAIKTLRFYDEAGILVPESVDQYTGYRYYGKKNVDKVFLIKALKDLGFTLKEIRYFNVDKLGVKAAELEANLTKLKSNITLLKTIKKEEDLKMLVKETFENDEQVIGKWVIVDSKNGFPIKVMYLLPSGEKYWVVSWTKGFIKFNDKKHKYEIKNDVMKIFIKDKTGKEELIEYKKENSIRYTKETIPAIKDNVELPFVEDAKILGTWNCVDFVEQIRYFNPNEKAWKWELMWKSFTFKKDGTVLSEAKNRPVGSFFKWTKGFVLNKGGEQTASTYEIKTIEGKQYLFVQHKSGDYTWGGLTPFFYVFEKE